jgi:uncharacterized OB-fold protein
MSDTGTSKIPAPLIAPENWPFWDAASEQRLLIKRCRSCSRFHWYPRGLCPFCLSGETEWVESSGSGAIYSHTVITGVAPVILAYVRLEEGITLLTNLVCEADQACIGRKVSVVFVSAENGQKVPMFKLAGEI